MASTVAVRNGVEVHPVGKNAGAERARTQEVTFVVDNMHCGGCLQSVEAALLALPDVTQARVNLSQRRVVVVMGEDADFDDPIAALKNAGFRASLLADFSDTAHDAAVADLTRRLGVAGFAMMNVMLLSVSVWSGAEGDMDASARSMFHWLSALIALPAIVYAGQPFFLSAVTALRAWRVDMDVPISLGVVLATGMSLVQTASMREHVYFDAAIMLLTFLLLGRLLDQMMRQRAESAASNLLKMRQPSVRVLGESGGARKVPVASVLPGMRVLLPAGERLAVDGRVVKGCSNVDFSIITGETVPQEIKPGDAVYAGAVNLLQPLVVEATAREDQSLLCEIANLMTVAEQQRGRYVRIADHAARLYAPLVHALAAVTLAGWLALGASWVDALPIAISVLIITCPCALALAVPAVQVAAAAQLLRRGIILKSADALERLCAATHFVFDKTGTLTRGCVNVTNADDIPSHVLASAAGLAASSTHPFSLAVVEAARGRGICFKAEADVEETPGFGLSVAGRGDALMGGLRLGSARWCGIDEPENSTASGAICFRDRGGDVHTLLLDDSVRPGARDVVERLKEARFGVELLSGDSEHAVARIAKAVGIDTYRSQFSPAQKVSRLSALKQEGARVAMVGDGLNDAPSLAAAHVSLSPASAAHISQAAADFVFQGDSVAPVAQSVATARAANALVRQNFALAAGYNIIFVPLAMLGLVTPFIAAIAMSVSSISVTANALRLHTFKMEI